MKTSTTIRKILAAAILALSFLTAAEAADGRTVIVMIKGGQANSAARFLSPAAALQARAAARPSARSLAPSAANVGDLWIVNGYSMKASDKDIAALANNPNVTVVENFAVRTPEMKPEDSSSGGGMENWGLAKIGAKSAWSVFGVTGKGVRIGHLDTGVDASHPDLAGKIAAWAEFDGNGNLVASSPHDSGIHGTHTAGILVGGSASGAPIGVAPGAKLVSALVLNGGSGTLVQVLAGMQWVLDPDGNPATDDGAQVLSMSLGASGQYQIFQDVTDRLLAAGVLPVFAVGNSGPGEADAPGNCVGAMAVGATMYSDQVASFSGGGLVNWNNKAYVKPEIVAPGYGIPSSIPGGRYQTMSGTSMATPHVAGAAALLLEANPNLSVDQLRSVLTSTARDLGDPGVDVRYGSGLLNVMAALAGVTQRSIVQGTTQGEGQPVPASIRVLNSAGKVVQTARADATTGMFGLSLPNGDYTINASYGQVRGLEKSVTAANGTVVTVNFAFTQASGLDNLVVYPNPFRASKDADVTFDGLLADTKVTVYSMSGEKVAEVSGGETGQVQWNGRNTSGETVAAGPYYYLASRYDTERGWEHKKGLVAVLR